MEEEIVTAYMELNSKRVWTDYLVDGKIVREYEKEKK